MNPSIKLLRSILVLSIFVFATAYEKPQWKGNIEYENGYYLYKIDYELESYAKIKCYKIKNWDQIREGI
jgi:hypothetical protein